MVILLLGWRQAEVSTVLGARRTATHLARVGTLTLDGLDDVHTLDDLSEDDVLAIEPVAGTGEHCSQYRVLRGRRRDLHGRDEELGSVAVGGDVNQLQSRDVWNL